jgi:hypothetical protein
MISAMDEVLKNSPAKPSYRCGIVVAMSLK